MKDTWATYVHYYLSETYELSDQLRPRELVLSSTVSFLALSNLVHLRTSFAGYERTAVILYRKDEERDIHLSLEGAEYALSILKAEKSPKPTQENQELVDLAISSFSSNAPDPAALVYMADIAILWNNRDMWTEIAKHNDTGCGPPPLTTRYTLAAAWKAFSFEAVRPL